MAEQIRTALTILRRKQVQAQTGLGRSAIYNAIGQGTFPKPVRLGNSRSVGWIEAEVLDWVAKQIIASRKAVA